VPDEEEHEGEEEVQDDGEVEEEVEEEKEIEEVEEEKEIEEVEEDDEEMQKSKPLTPEQMHALHAQIDNNGNGMVSLAEVTNFAQKMRRALAKSELDKIMTDMDTDKDGKLSWPEFLGDAREMPEEEQNEKHTQFKDLDINNDQALDMDELAQMYHHHTNDKVEMDLTILAMKDRDTDKNGALSLREFFQDLQVEGEPLVRIEAEEQKLFKQLDKDNSGTLTLTELKAWESGSYQAETAVKKLFAKADENGDNVLTAEEMAGVRHELADDKDYEPQMYLSQWAEQHETEM